MYLMEILENSQKKFIYVLKCVSQIHEKLIFYLIEIIKINI